jgi:hypothetical protein
MKKNLKVVKWWLRKLYQERNYIFYSIICKLLLIFEQKFFFAVRALDVSVIDELPPGRKPIKKVMKKIGTLPDNF